VAPFRFQFRKFRIWPAALIGIFLAVDRPDMRRIFIGIWSPDSKILSMCIDPFPKALVEIHRCARVVPLTLTTSAASPWP